MSSGMISSTLFVVSALLAITVSTSHAERLRVKPATITIAKSTAKDALTFTGSYPATILTEQELQRDTELTVSFGLLTDDGSDMAVFPQQCYLMVQVKGTDIATYRSARLKDAKLTVKTDVPFLLRQLGKHTRMELTLIVGDPRFDEAVVWNLGTIGLDASIVNDVGITDPPLPRRLYEPKPKPEIQHIYREPDARPPAVVSIIFAFLSLCPLAAYLVYVHSLDVSLKGMPSASSRIWVILFHTGLAMILVLYALFFFRLNLVQMFVPLSCLSVFCFFTGYRVLCAVAGTHEKEKVA